jgi:serine/threonine protein kinase
MEYIPGRTLDTLLTTSLDIPAVLSLLKEILEVVAVLHAQQVIHRDITPRNLIRYAATGAERETRWRTTGQLFQQ